MPKRTALARWINQRCFYGWVMLGVGFMGMLCTGPGQSYTIGLFFGPLHSELGLSATTLSLTYGVGTAVAALGLSYTGRLVDRHGPRRVLAAIALLFGVACVLFPLVNHALALLLAFTAVRFLGQGSLALASTNLVSQWWVRRRGMALSVTSLGFALGLAAFPPVVQRLIGTVGWRETWIWMGIAVSVVLVPLALALVIDRPDELGVAPDGALRGMAPAAGGVPAAAGGVPAAAAADTRSAGAASSSTPAATPEENWTPREALRTATFWTLAVALAIPSALITGMYVYHVSYFREQGLSPRLAADMFTITSVSMVVAMLLCGQLLDRVPARFVISGGILLNSAALAVMYFARDPITAVVYAVLLGATTGAMMTNSNFVWPHYFGRRHLGGIQGPAYTVTIIGASLGALPFGIAFDLLGSYREAVALLALLPLGFGTAVAFLKPPVRSALAAAAGPPG